MALCYNISYGIAAGFLTYCLIRIYKGETRQAHPLMWIFTGLFVVNFVMLALISPPKRKTNTWAMPVKSTENILSVRMNPVFSRKGSTAE